MEGLLRRDRRDRRRRGQSPYAEAQGQISQDGTIAFAQLNITDRDQTEFLDFAEEVQALDDDDRRGHGRSTG